MFAGKIKRSKNPLTIFIIERMGHSPSKRKEPGHCGHPCNKYHVNPTAGCEPAVGPTKAAGCRATPGNRLRLDQSATEFRNSYMRTTGKFATTTSFLLGVGGRLRVLHGEAVSLCGHIGVSHVRVESIRSCFLNSKSDLTTW